MTRIPFESTPCRYTTRKCVIATAFTYLDALVSHDAASVRLAPDVVRTHNGHAGGVRGADALRSVILLEPVYAHYNFRWIVDGSDAVAFFDMAIDASRSGKTPDDGFAPFSEHRHTVIAERFRVEAGEIHEIAVFWLHGQLTVPPHRPYRRTAPPGEEAPMGRDDVVAAATGYLDALATGDAAAVALAPDVWCIEEGVLVADGRAAVIAHVEEVGGRHGTAVDQRWYVEGGQAAVYYSTDGGRHVAQRFRVEAGQIKEVESIVGAPAMAGTDTASG